MNVQVGKWGNSLAIRIPGGIAKDAGIKDGTDLELQVVEGSIMLRPAAPSTPQFTLQALLNQVSPDALHEEVAWGPSEGHEAW